MLQTLEEQNLITLYKNNDFNAAATKAKEIIERVPSSFVAWKIVGEINYKLKNFEQAAKAFHISLNINSKDANGFNTLGVCLAKLGDLDGAIKNFNEAIDNNPNYDQAYNNLGIMLAKKSKFNSALSFFSKAILINHNNHDAISRLCQILKFTVFTKSHFEIVQAINIILKKRHRVRPYEIEPSAISLIKHEKEIKSLILAEDKKEFELALIQFLKNLAKYEMFMELISLAPISDKEIESVLERARKYILLNIHNLQQDDNLIKFLTSLSLHLHLNEYIYTETKTETVELKKLTKFIQQKFDNKSKPKLKYILCACIYRSLNSFNFADKAVEIEGIDKIKYQQFDGPVIEEKIKSNLKSLHEVKEQNSLKVKQQYEMNPYPRWTDLRIVSKPYTIKDLISRAELKLHQKSILNVKEPEILVAGCGTGQHVIETATIFKNSRVTAIDLSASSLAFAVRKSKELGINNISFIQGDILDLSKLEKKFDIIECSGVLHHMQSPKDGWKVLVGCMRPNALMNIGLYSKMARKHISKTRSEISDLVSGHSNFQVKNIRKKILNSNLHHHKLVQQSNDFYSLSACVDLLFHVKEHQFDLLDIQKFLIDLDLGFSGFSNPKIVSDFRKSINNSDNIYDLNRWNEYELMKPLAFSRMYQFWCQKL